MSHWHSPQPACPGLSHPRAQVPRLQPWAQRLLETDPFQMVHPGVVILHSDPETPGPAASCSACQLGEWMKSPPLSAIITNRFWEHHCPSSSGLLGLCVREDSETASWLVG